jgi:hypothetical protein
MTDCKEACDNGFGVVCMDRAVIVKGFVESIVSCNELEAEALEAGCTVAEGSTDAIV